MFAADFVSKTVLPLTCELSDEEFMTLAEQQGLVYTKEGFIDRFNCEGFNSLDCYLRIIDVGM